MVTNVVYVCLIWLILSVIALNEKNIPYAAV